MVRFNLLHYKCMCKCVLIANEDKAKVIKTVCSIKDVAATSVQFVQPASHPAA